MPDLKIKVRIQGSDEASAPIKKVRSAMGGLASFIKSRFVITLGDVTRVLRGMVNVFKDVIEASKEQETVVSRLDAALASLGPSAAGVSKRLQEQAAALQKITRYGDETIIQGQALIATFVKDEEMIKGATVAALDFASAMKVDVNTAFLLMAKAGAGNVSLMSRYGIQIDENIPKSQQFAEVLKLIAVQMGGRAAADAKTFAGAVDQLGNAFGDLKEVAGDAVTKNKQIQESLQGIKAQLEDKGTIAAVTTFARILVSLGTGTVGLALAKLESLVGIGEKLGSGLAKVGLDISKLFVPPLVEGTRSIEGLRTASERAGKGIGTVTDAADRTGPKLNELALAAQATAVGLDASAEAMKKIDEAAKALGATTSTQLLVQFKEMTQALEDQKNTLGEISPEYKKLAEDTAPKLEALKLRIESLAQGLGDIAPAAVDAADGLDKLGTAAGDAAKGLDASTKAVMDFDEATKVLGGTTSVELVKQIAEINAALEVQRTQLGAGTAEFAHQQDLAAEKIAVLRERIASLRAGFGDLEPAADGAAGAVDKFGDAQDKAGKGTKTLNDGLKAQVAQVRLTALEFDKLSASMGRAAAVAAALEAGNRTNASGTRIYLPGGGSRLTSTPGFGGGRYPSGQYPTGQYPGRN